MTAFLPLCFPRASLLAQIDEDDARQHEHYGERYDPPQGATPPDAVDVEEEVGKPLVTCDEVTGVDEGDI